MFAHEVGAYADVHLPVFVFFKVEMRFLQLPLHFSPSQTQMHGHSIPDKHGQLDRICMVQNISKKFRQSLVVIVAQWQFVLDLGLLSFSFAFL